MKSYVQLLEDEIHSSKQFTQQNFGLKVGDGFPEMVREIVGSKEVSAQLLVNLMMVGLCGKDVADSLKRTDGRSSELAVAGLENSLGFETPLSMFYWGVQVGRKMEKEVASFTNWY